MTTPATSKPLKRLVSGRTDGPLVAEITAEEVRLRPPHTRHGSESEVIVPWQSIYRNALIARSLTKRHR